MEREFFCTADLYSAAFLLANPEVQFHGLQTHNAHKKLFVFSPRQRCDRLVLNLVAGRADINARSFCDAIRRAKDLVFGADRAQKGVIQVTNFTT